MPDAVMLCKKCHHWTNYIGGNAGQSFCCWACGALMYTERKEMSYKYSIERSKIFTEKGLKDYQRVRDKVLIILKETGAFAFYGLKNVGVDWWFTQTCLDYMIEQGELICLRDEIKAWMQFQIYASPKTHNR